MKRVLRKLPALAWTLPLLAAAVAVGAGKGSGARALLPAVLLLAGVGGALRPRAPGAWYRVAVELRGVQLPALVLWSVPPLLVPVHPGLAALVFALAAPQLMVAGVGRELDEGGLDAWLAQPLSRTRLLAEKLGVAAPLLLGALGQAWLLLPAQQALLATSAAALGLGLAPALLLCTRHALFAGLATSVGAAALQGLWAVLPGRPGPAALAATALALGAAALYGARGRLASLHAPAAPALQPGAGRWPWRGPARPTWLRKELRLQRTTVLVASLVVAAWALVMALPGARGAAAELAGFCGLGVGLLAGLIPLCSERRYGTLELDLLAQPQARVWRARVGVALGTGLLCGVLLPLGLMAATVLLSRWLGAPVPAPVSPVGPILWAALVLTCVPVGLAAAARVPGLARAFIAACAGVAALALWLGLAVAAAGWGTRAALRLLAAGDSRWLVLSRAQGQVLFVLLTLAMLGAVGAAVLAAARRAFLPGSRHALRPLPTLATLAGVGALWGTGAMLMLALSR